MRIVDQSHKILSYTIGTYCIDGMIDDSERCIERVGRVCYKSEDRITADSYKRFNAMLLKRGHEAMVEHASATVHFVTDRGVSHELVRHRLASFAQESTRYCDYAGGHVTFVKPVWMDKSVIGVWPGDELAADHCTNENIELISDLIAAENLYKAWRQRGWPPEKARGFLPNFLKTEIVITANFREWRHIFKLRAIGTTGRPHPQMQALMLPVLAEFQQLWPTIFETIGETNDA